jgi:hypothetical protein
VKPADLDRTGGTAAFLIALSGSGMTRSAEDDHDGSLEVVINNIGWLQPVARRLNRLRLSRNDPRLRFGLELVAAYDRIKIQWRRLAGCVPVRES